MLDNALLVGKSEPFVSSGLANKGIIPQPVRAGWINLYRIQEFALQVKFPGTTWVDS